MRPTFMILGAAKSGTTSLAYYLGQHPEIYMSEPKEPYFFELEYAKGMDFYWNTYFKEWQGEPHTGEANPVNLFLPYVPARIRAELPEVKLLAVLRNPIERAFSGWWMRHSFGIEKLPFEQAIAANLTQQQRGEFIIETLDEARWREVKHWAQKRPQVKVRWYLEQGYYAEQIARYLKLFPAAQFKVLFFEDLVCAPDALLKDMLQFLGADTDFSLRDRTPQMTATPAAGVPLLRAAQGLRIHKLIPRGWRQWASRLFQKVSAKPQLSPALRLRLVEHYQAHNRELEQLIGRDLSHWNR